MEDKFELLVLVPSTLYYVFNVIVQLWHCGVILLARNVFLVC